MIISIEINFALQQRFQVSEFLLYLGHYHESHLAACKVYRLPAYVFMEKKVRIRQTAPCYLVNFWLLFKSNPNDETYIVRYSVSDTNEHLFGYKIWTTFGVPILLGR